MKQLDGTPFFADLMPESIHTQAKNSIGSLEHPEDQLRDIVITKGSTHSWWLRLGVGL
jgi:hypothetical protein